MRECACECASSGGGESLSAVEESFCPPPPLLICAPAVPPYRQTHRGRSPAGSSLCLTAAAPVRGRVQCTATIRPVNGREGRCTRTTQTTVLFEWNGIEEYNYHVVVIVIRLTFPSFSLSLPTSVTCPSQRNPVGRRSLSPFHPLYVLSPDHLSRPPATDTCTRSPSCS